MTTTRKWMHPDIILGKCIDGIGDARYSLKDTQRQSRLAWRQKQFTAKFNYSGWPKEMKSKWCDLLGFVRTMNVFLLLYT